VLEQGHLSLCPDGPENRRERLLAGRGENFVNNLLCPEAVIFVKEGQISSRDGTFAPLVQGE
jgi:hypothetical protein